MNPIRPNERKEKVVSIAGVILSGIFSVNVFFTSFYEIFKVCGGDFFELYHTVFAVFYIVHFLLGWILIPLLSIIFIVQAIRYRKNRTYIKNCVFLVLLCAWVFLSGCFVRAVSPVIEKTVVDIKIQFYQSTVAKIHRGEEPDKYADMAGGIKGREDVAFFQYSIGSDEKIEYYILYSEDADCDVDAIKEHARGLPLYNISSFEMEELKENWYRLEATHKLNP